MNNPFGEIIGQEQVVRYLQNCLQNDRLSHAYLFAGPKGSGKIEVAYALAQSLLCPDNGCMACETCRRVGLRKHPDVMFLKPEGVKTYLVEQIRELVTGVELAPIQATGKVYIIDRAEQMNAASANAFLKTLEEPPAGVTFILLAGSAEGVLPTLVSRCQVVNFSEIDADVAVEYVSRKTGQDPDMCRGVLQACGGSLTEARVFCESHHLVAFRIRIFEMLESLQRADDLEVLAYSKEIQEAMKAPVEELRVRLEAEAARDAEFMGKAVSKQAEAGIKRALTAKTGEIFLLVTGIIVSWLRDLLLMKAGAGEQIANRDRSDGLFVQAFGVSDNGIVTAVEACRRAERLIAYNVSMQNVTDDLLFNLRRALFAR